MKVKSENWIKFDGSWIPAGRIFNVPAGQYETIKEYVSVIEEDKEQPSDEKEQFESVLVEQTEPVQKTNRGRKKKQ